MTNETIKRAVLSLVKKYSITKVILFGSRASNKNRPDSDVDLIVEFANPITKIISEMQVGIDLLGNMNLEDFLEDELLKRAWV